MTRWHIALVCPAVGGAVAFSGYREWPTALALGAAAGLLVLMLHPFVRRK